MKRVITLYILLLLTVGLATAKDYDFKIKQARVEKVNDRMMVSFTIDSVELSSSYRLLLTPVIYDSTGRVQELKPLILVGRERNIYDKRSENVDPDIERHVVKSRKQQFRYAASLPYEAWMQYVSLAMSETLEGCCHTVTQLPTGGGDAIAEGLLLTFDPTPHFQAKPLQYQLSELEKYDISNPFLHPMEDYSKRYDVLVKNRDKASGKIIFKQGKSEIDMNYADNRKMMAAMEQAFRIIEQDSNAVLKKIVIAAFSSPEGSLALNTRLAAARGESVRKYFASIMKNPEAGTFEVINGREDWSGLRSAVEKSNMEDKEEVLKIIDGYTINQEIRKTLLQRLNGGKPYKWMLANLYPPLRNGGYLQIFYEVQRKAHLSWTDENRHQIWIDPESPRNKFVTAYNKAANDLVDGNYEAVIKELLPYGKDSRTWNYLGVAYMMKNELDVATLYFEKAKANDDPDAIRNLEEIKWIRKVTVNSSH